jgi:hypothetical protein
MKLDWIFPLTPASHTLAKIVQTEHPMQDAIRA